MPDTLYTPSAPTSLGSADPAAGGATVIVAAAALTDTATIERPTRTSDGAGGEDLVYAPVAVGVACAIDRATTYREAQQGGREQGVVVFVGRFQLGTDLRDDDRVLANDNVFEVIGTDAGITNALFLTADLVRVL